jgi:hypothetical protein
MSSSRSRRLVLPGLLLAGLVASGCAVSAEAVPAAPPMPAPAVGDNAAVQTWFKQQEKARIAVNNALQQAYLQLDNAPGAGNGCAQLKAAAEAVLALTPPPKQALDALVEAGVAQFRDGAVACLAGDVGGARGLFATGAQARADAENEIEEVLEAPNGTVN